ncbi:MAG: hypothetical protein ABJP86_11810 [Flavobacteriaceae bacterium]
MNRLRLLIVLIFSFLISNSTFSQENTVKELLKEIDINEVVNDTLNLSIINFFKGEEKGEFVSNERIKDLYSIINSLKGKAVLNANNTLLFFKLRKIIKKNVELSEYMAECITDIALESQNNFIIAFYLSDDELKEKIESDLFWLIEIDKYSTFKEKLNSSALKEEFNIVVDRLSKLDE